MTSVCERPHTSSIITNTYNRDVLMRNRLLRFCITRSPQRTHRKEITATLPISSICYQPAKLGCSSITSSQIAARLVCVCSQMHPGGQAHADSRQETTPPWHTRTHNTTSHSPRTCTRITLQCSHTQRSVPVSASGRANARRQSSNVTAPPTPPPVAQPSHDHTPSCAKKRR